MRVQTRAMFGALVGGQPTPQVGEFNAPAVEPVHPSARVNSDAERPAPRLVPLGRLAPDGLLWIDPNASAAALAVVMAGQRVAT